MRPSSIFTWFIWTLRPRSNKYKIFGFKTKGSSSACSGQKSLSYLTPTVWNNSPTCLNLSNTLISLKHGVKRHFLKKLKNKEQNAFAY